MEKNFNLFLGDKMNIQVTIISSLVFLASCIPGSLQRNNLFDVQNKEGSNLDNSAAVSKDKNDLTFLRFNFNGTDNENSITQSFTVPDEGGNGSTISWTSDNAAITFSSTSAVVIQPAPLTSNITITLTAKIEKSDVSETKAFIVTLITQVPSTGDQVTFTIGAISFKMIYVPAIMTFPTGLNDSSTETVASAFLIADTEVTYELWYAVYNWGVNGIGTAIGEGEYIFENLGDEGSNDGTPTTLHAPTLAKLEPVTYISWRDAIVFTNALTEYYNAQKGTSLKPVYYSDGSYINPIRDSSDATCGASSIGSTDGDCDNPFIFSSTQSNKNIANNTATGFRLPDSAEWKLAARYKTDTGNDSILNQVDEYYPGNYASGATGTQPTAIDAVAVSSNNFSQTQNVKSLSGNGLNLFDMSGNAMEWAFNWANAVERNIHGGSYNNIQSNVLVSTIITFNPYLESTDLSFRLVKNP